MNGFDELGTHDIPRGTLLGFDYMSLLKGGAGMLSGAGGLMSGGGGANAPADAEKQRLQAEKAAAEKSAATLKTILIVGASVLGGVLLLSFGLGGRTVVPVAKASR